MNNLYYFAKNNNKNIICDGMLKYIQDDSYFEKIDNERKEY